MLSCLLSKSIKKCISLQWYSCIYPIISWVSGMLKEAIFWLSCNSTQLLFLSLLMLQCCIPYYCERKKGSFVLLVFMLDWLLLNLIYFIQVINELNANSSNCGSGFITKSSQLSIAKLSMVFSRSSRGRGGDWLLNMNHILLKVQAQRLLSESPCLMVSLFLKQLWISIFFSYNFHWLAFSIY